MKSNAILVGFVVAVSACSGERPTSPSTPPATYTLSGTVWEATIDGQFPVAGALVREENSSKAATTDENGRYEIAGLRAVNNAVVSSKSGYVSGRIQVTISGDTRLDITIVRQGAHTLSGVAFEVTPAGNVPLEGVDIYCDGCGEFGHTGVRTDARGFYLFPLVYSGVQYLQVGKQGYKTVLTPAGFGLPVTVSGNTEFNIQLVRQ